MIYMLRGLYEAMSSTFTGYTGGWWFSTQEPLDLDPIVATITEDNESSEPGADIDFDDGTPLPPAIGSEKPVCTGCGDPNFSLEGDLCIACRIGMP